MDVLLQSPQSLLRGLKDIIRLADRESEVILRDMRVCIRVEFRRRNCCHADFLDQEPREFKVARAVRDVWREGVAVGDLDRGHVDKDEIATFGVRVLLHVSHSRYA